MLITQHFLYRQITLHTWLQEEDNYVLFLPIKRSIIIWKFFQLLVIKLCTITDTTKRFRKQF